MVQLNLVTLASSALLAASYLLGKEWPEDLANTNGHCPTQIMGKLVKVTTLFTADMWGKVLRK